MEVDAKNRRGERPGERRVDRTGDRRVQRTRLALRQALRDLILEKGYEQVTIEEITERANLGRTTFYLHYRTKEDLLLESFADLIDSLLQEIASIPLSDWINEGGGERGLTERPLSPIRKIFEHAAENAAMYRLALQGEGMLRITERLRQFVTLGVQTFLRLKSAQPGQGLTLLVPEEIFANYMASALVGMVTWWLAQPGAPSPAEISVLFQRMFIPGAREVICLEGQG